MRPVSVAVLPFRSRLGIFNWLGQNPSFVKGFHQPVACHLRRNTTPCPASCSTSSRPSRCRARSRASRKPPRMPRATKHGARLAKQSAYLPTLYISRGQDRTARGGRTGRGGGGGGCRASGFVPRASPGLKGFGVGGGGGLDACAMGMGGRCRFVRSWCA